VYCHQYASLSLVASCLFLLAIPSLCRHDVHASFSESSSSFHTMAVISTSTAPAARLAARASPATRLSSKSKVGIALGIVLPVLFLFVLFCGFVYLRRRKARFSECRESRPSSFEVHQVRRYVGEDHYEDITPSSLRRSPFGIVVSRDSSESAKESLKADSIAEHGEAIKSTARVELPAASRAVELPAGPVPETFSEPASLARRLYLSSILTSARKFGTLRGYVGKGKQRLDPGQSAVSTIGTLSGVTLQGDLSAVHCKVHISR
jgi:hypothetical protein